MGPFSCQDMKLQKREELVLVGRSVGAGKPRDVAAGFGFFGLWALGFGPYVFFLGLVTSPFGCQVKASFLLVCC